MATTKYCLDDDEKRLYTRSLTMCTRRDERILIKKRKITFFFLLRRLLAEYFYFKKTILMSIFVGFAIAEFELF